jgi:hypothetical protein
MDEQEKLLIVNRNSEISQRKEMEKRKDKNKGMNSKRAKQQKSKRTCCIISLNLLHSKHVERVKQRVKRNGTEQRR